MRVSQFRIEGLGHLSTLLADDAAGVAVVVDPRRDVDLYRRVAAADGLRISHVVETHLHNDYVSGGRELAALTGATHVIGAGAELQHDHRPIHDHETFQAGSVGFRALDTPGHTPEHVSYEVIDLERADDPFLVLTGGSLLVGAVGRTDLLGAGHAAEYAAAMHRSLHDVLLPHEDSVMVYPTHGAGSLCSTGIAETSWSTIGFERRHDPLLGPLEVEAFTWALLEGQPAFPRYFARMRPINQAGPALLGGIVPAIPARSVETVAARVADGALVVDARSPGRHVAGHIAGSLSIPADASFGTWLGWMVDPDRPVVLLVESTDDLDELSRQVLRIGMEGSIVGHLDGGLEAWRASGRPVGTGGRLDVMTLAHELAGDPADRPLVIDVRQPTEYAAGHVPGSRHIHAPDLPQRLADVPRDRPIACICASGFRASIASSLLRSRGFERVAWVEAGVPAWEAAGLPVEWGEPAASGEPASPATSSR
jgi:hydroxyacylglutathione hydrolase